MTHRTLAVAGCSTASAFAFKAMRKATNYALSHHNQILPDSI
jgi:hypothetical protein